MSSNAFKNISTNHVVKVYTINSKGQKVFKSINKNNNRKIDHNNIQIFVDTLSIIKSRRKCYTFQLLKQFFLYPQDVESSTISISPYDKIIFDDEAIHTMVRMYETKEKESIIWAFLNLKFWRIYKKVAKFTEKVDGLTGKVKHRSIKEGFKHIQIYSMMFSPKKSESNSGLTRVVSNSVISTKKPGHIYQSEVKRIKINTNQIYKSRDLEHQKSQDKYKSRVIPRYYQNHYPQSTNYIHYQNLPHNTLQYSNPQQYTCTHQSTTNQCTHHCANQCMYHQQINVIITPNNAHITVIRNIWLTNVTITTQVAQELSICIQIYLNTPVAITTKIITMIIIKLCVHN